MNQLPVVTVVVPARNEARDIEKCIVAIASQDYPVTRTEVLVVDGHSTDGTAQLARQVLSRFGFEHSDVVSSPGGTTPENLNLGLRIARGDIVCRVDARTIIQQHYVRTCVGVLTTRPDVAVVGGAQRAVASDRRAVSVGIARALNNRWATGFSRYRRASTSGESDTVYLGAFRTAELRDAGGWDERLNTNQDYDLNRRMADVGTVWFDAALESGYIPRPDLRSLWTQYVRFGRWKARYWQLTGQRPAPRQWALLLGPPVLGAGFLCWLVIGPWRQRFTLGAVGGLAGALAIEVCGADEPRGGPVAHVAGAAAMTTVAAGWLAGVWDGLVRRGIG